MSLAAQSAPSSGPPSPFYTEESPRELYRKASAAGLLQPARQMGF